MAAITCTAQNLASLTPCQFSCLNGDLVMAIRIRLLCAILNGETMICDATTLAEAAKCFLPCVSLGLAPSIEIYLLCQIANGGGGGGTGGVICAAAADPSGAPTNACTLAYRVDNGKLWYWDAGGTAWVPLIS